MARGKRNNNNNKRGRGGSVHNTTSDSDGNRSNVVHEGRRDVRDHKGFSTGAFGTSDIDGSGLQSEVIIERSEMNHHGRNTTEFSEEIHVPTRSRTSSLGADPNEGFLNPNDYALNAFGQNSQSSVRSRTSISNFEKAHRMSQLSIQTNQDEFVLVPGSGGHDGHASVRSMRSQASRQSANVAMSSRDDILTEGDETGGDELRDEGVRARLDSRASQFSRGSAFGSPVEIPVGEQTGYRSRRQSENAGGEWESTQPAQDRRSHTSLYSHKSNGWPEGEVQKEYVDVPPQGAQNGYVHIPSCHSSRASNYSRGADGWDQERGGFGGDQIQVPVQLSRHASRASLHSRGADGYDQEGGELRRDEIQVPIHLSRHASRASVHSRGAEGWDQEGGPREEEIQVPIQLSRHASKTSVMSHRSNVPDNVGFGDVRGYGSRAPSHHASKMSVASHRSDAPDVSEYVEGAKFIGGQGLGSRTPSHHASKTSVYSSMSRGGALMEDQWGEQTGRDLVDIPSREEKNGPSRSESKISLKLDAPEVDEWDNNEQVFGGGGVSHASRHSLRSGYGSNAPSHHASKVSIHSHAGGDAGVAPFNASRPQSVHASRASIYSHAPEGTDSRAPSHHASRTSIHSHTAGEVGFGSRAPSHHASRASIHSHAYCEEEEEVENGGMNGFIPEEEGRTNGTSGTSTRSRLSCIACADDTEEGLEEHEKLELPQLGDEIEVPPEAVEEWGEHVDEQRGEEERMMENGHFGDTGSEWRHEDEIGDEFIPPAVNEEGRRQQRSAYGSRASIATHTVDVPSIGGRSHHASRMSMRSAMGGVDGNDDGRHGGLQQTTFGGSTAPIPAIRLSRASLNQHPTMDWNHNSMSNLHGGEFTDENQMHIPSHHASKTSLRSVRSEMAQDPMQTALSKMSIHSHHSAPRERRFSSNSTQDVAEWGETVNEDDDEEVFEHHGGYVEYDGGMSRGTSHRSIYSTRSSKAGEQTEENLLQAIINRSREPSLGSLADRPYIPPKDGWKSSTHSVKSTNDEDGKTRSRRESRSASVHLVGAGIDLPLNIPIPQSRSRSVSVTSRRSFDGVVFADQPELYSHPDDRFGGDKTIEGIPFRRTNDHEKTPQPTSKRGSRIFKHHESDDELRALVSSASHTSVVENTPPPSAGFNTPKSRNSRESYLGTADISMPSPSPFNQTQFQREEFEAFKERASRSSTTPFLPFSPSSEKNEMATQTGETIARAAGQRFALHYGATQSAKPRRGPSGQIPPSAQSSSYSVGPPPPPSCSPPHEEECTLQHHQPMGDEEEERKRQHYAALYDHGDMGDVARKSSSHSSSRFAPLPTYDMSYVEQYEARSMASASKTTTTVSTSSSSSTTLKSQYATGAASAASSYIDHLRPVQPSPAHTNVAMKGMGGARGVNSMEMTTTNGGYYRQEMSEALFSPSKGTVAQKTAAFRQKEEEERGGMGTHEYSPVYANYLQRPVNRQVPIEMVRGGEEPIERKMHQQPKIVNVEIKRASSSVGQRPVQSGYVHIERPKMNNSFERNNHPAAAVLNSMLSARASPNSSRSEDNPLLTRQPSSVGGTTGAYLPQPMGYVPPPPPLLPSYGGQSMGGLPKGVITSPSTPGYQRSIRPLASEDATFHYEMKHDLSSQQIEKKTNEEISKDEQSVLSRVGAIRADVSPQGMAQMRQPLRSREAERAYTTYHDKKSQGTSSVPITSAPKPFTPSSPYRSAALGQQQQMYGAYRAMAVPQAPVKKTLLHPQTTRGGGGVTRVEKERGTEKKVVGPIEQNKYTGSTIRRAIPQRGHIRNLAAAFDKVQTKADQEVTVIEPHNSSVEKRRGGTSTVGGPLSSGRGVGGSTSSTSSSRVFASSRSEGLQQSGVGHGQDEDYRVAPAGTTTTSGSTRVEEREEREEEYEMMRRSGYNERSIHEWQTANEQQMRQEQQRDEQGWSGRDEEEELLLDSESDRPVSIHSGGATKGRIIPAHVLRTSTPLAGVKNDPRSLARALEKIPSIRGDDTIGRGRGRDVVRGVRTGGVRALASRFEKAAEEETEKARSASMTPKLRRRESPRRVEGEDAEDRREAAARRLSRGMGGMERLEREREKRRSQSAHAAMRKRRSESTSDSGEESVMRDMEAVERMAREDILRKEREEMRGRKAMKTATKNEMRGPSEEERKVCLQIDEMFHGLESQESAGERGTMASSRGTMSGGESVRTERQERQERGERREEMYHPFHQQQQLLQHQHYQYQQQYREHHQHQHHHYQSHLQSVNQPSNAPHLQSIPSQQPPPAAHSVQQQQQLQQRPHSPNYLASHLLPLGANGALEHGVVTRRESTQTMHQTTTNTQSSTATGLVYSPSVYRETGRALRGDVSAPANGLSSMIPMEKGRGDGRAATMDANMTASSPHFSPVNIRGPETAGQRVATYESRDGRNPVRIPSRQVRPYALATSTPMGTVHSSNRGTTLVNEGVVIAPDAVEDDSFLSTISNESRGSVIRSPANQAEYKKQISRLQTVQSMEEEKISITSKALAHARKKQNPSNELAAQRTILLARLRVAALKRELQRLSALAIVRNPPPPVNKSVLGAMDISDITLHLNRNLCARPGDGGSCSFGFIVVLKCGVEVEATAPVCILVPQRPAGVKVVHFPEHLRFSNLPVDFTIRLEVYVMKLREPKEESCTALLATKARNLLGPGTRRAAITAGPGGSSGSGGSPCAINGELPVGELVRCGNTALDRDSIGSIRLYLDSPEYPLEGTIELMSRCSRLPSSVEVDLRGFLTMYKVVGGYGSWVRYWAVLRRGVINFWKYPDDEQLDRGGPVASADLSKCTDSEIVPAPREICTRQFAFSIDMLVATTPSIVEKKRVLLAADSREFLKAWLAALNETLIAIRA